MATKKTEENVDLKAAKEQLEALKEEINPIFGGV